MLDFYAHGSSDPAFDLQEFERQALTLENGLAMTWDEVGNLGLKVGQTIDCLLIGDRKEGNLKRCNTEEEQYMASEIVLELIDGGCWEIRAKDPAIIERIVRHFDGNAKFKISEI